MVSYLTRFPTTTTSPSLSPLIISVSKPSLKPITTALSSVRARLWLAINMISPSLVGIVDSGIASLCSSHDVVLPVRASTRNRWLVTVLTPPDVEKATIGIQKSSPSASVEIRMYESVSPPGIGEVAGHLLGLAEAAFGQLRIDRAVPDPVDVGRGLPVPNQCENRPCAHRVRSIAIARWPTPRHCDRVRAPCPSRPPEAFAARPPCCSSGPPGPGG